MAKPSSSARWRVPFLVAGGCALLFACVVVIAAAAAVFALRSRTQTAAPSVEYILDASPRMIEPSEGGWLELTPFGDGEPLRGVSHRDCAERAKGSLATF